MIANIIRALHPYSPDDDPAVQRERELIAALKDHTDAFNQARVSEALQRWERHAPLSVEDVAEVYRVSARSVSRHLAELIRSTEGPKGSLVRLSRHDVEAAWNGRRDGRDVMPRKALKTVSPVTAREPPRPTERSAGASDIEVRMLAKLEPTPKAKGTMKR